MTSFSLRLRFRLLFVPGRGHEGRYGDERQDHRCQAFVRRPSPAQGRPQGSPRRPVHAEDRRHEDATADGTSKSCSFVSKSLPLQSADMAVLWRQLDPILRLDRLVLKRHLYIDHVRTCEAVEKLIV